MSAWLQTTKSDLKVTVAMPAYNVEAFVDEAIRSVLAQRGSLFELIITDDGSSDGTWGRIRTYRSDPRVRVLRNPRNAGQGATRNRMTRLARGTYLVPCDADDIMLPGALARLSAYLDGNPAAGAVYADLLEIRTDARGRVTEPPRICGVDHRKTWDLVENVINHPGSMIRTRLVGAVGGYDEAVYSIDDWTLWLKLAEVTKIAYLPGEIYYVWRRRPSSVTKTDTGRLRDVRRVRMEAIRRRYG
jgi:glycosyltransferase involved in cell wall biosynthesis